MRNETYSLRQVTTFLKERNIPYKYSNANVGISFYNHGCRIDVNDTYKLSIQTHTDIVGPSFAETALQDVKKGQIVYNGIYGYIDVIRWDSPQELFDHIDTIMKSPPETSEDPVSETSDNDDNGNDS
jgi:hypothetical protein